MKQYRVTAADFVAPGETGDPDTVMDSRDLAELRKLAGLDSLNLLEAYTDGNTQDPSMAALPNDSNQQIMSPVGSNISLTGQEKRNLEKKYNIQPGTPEWFKLWLSRPYLTGEKPIGDAPAPRIEKNHKPGHS